MSSRLPPLNAVRAFEATARLGTLARAAEELGVTHGAVSKQILQLEDQIGTQLFMRLPSGVELTDAGKNLRDALIPAFRLLNSAFQHYGRRPQHAQRIRVATVASFAHAFLVPRLNQWYRDHPELLVELLTSDRLIDPTREDADIVIRYGRGDWPGIDAEPLGDFGLIAVGSAEQTASAQRALRESEVFEFARIQSAARNEWQSWSQHFDIRLSDETEHFMEHFVVAVQAAIGGLGFALLPELMVRDDLSAKRLVRLQDHDLPWEAGFFIATIGDALDRQNVRTFVRWLHDVVARP